MRRFIRHPFEIPIEIQSLGVSRQEQSRLSNISLGGLCFYSPQSLPVGDVVSVTISVTQPPFQARARVVWCDDADGVFEVGAEMLDVDEAYRARMVEQLCHIEHYKREAWMQDGRRLTSEQAAREWIAKYADDFPRIYELETEESEF